MDSQLFRLNQMSYQHQKQFLPQQQQQQQQNQRGGQGGSQNPTLSSQRQHYSNRQQGAGQLSSTGTGQRERLGRGQQQQQPQQQFVGGRTSASSGSDQDEQVQLSSLSTATTQKSSSSSRAAMLAANQRSSGQMQRDQHHQLLRQQQQQRHRQAALQAHSLVGALTSAGSKSQAQLSKGATAATAATHLASSDQLTTSSDQTIDELHHLAPQHHAFGAAASKGASNGRQARHHLTRAISAPAHLADSQSGSRFLLGVLFTIAELLLFATLFLWLYWAYQHDDGLAWHSDRKQQFNGHAALMLLGFVFLAGQAMLIHRAFSCCSKIYTKILHTILLVLATSAIGLGLVLAYTAQENVGANNKPIMHFYSLHAWCGLATVALFAFQFVFGFVSFLILLCCDQATASYRAALLPIHKTFGLIIFSLAVATCLTGLLQTARSRLSSKLNKTDYHELAEPGIIINLIGVCLICLAIIMPFIIRNLDIKRSFRSRFDRHLNKLSQLDMRI